MTTTLEKGRQVSAKLNPDLERILADRYDGAVPGMAESLIDWAYGHHYARDGLDMRIRQPGVYWKHGHLAQGSNR